MVISGNHKGLRCLQDGNPYCPTHQKCVDAYKTMINKFREHRLDDINDRDTKLHSQETKINEEKANLAKRMEELKIKENNLQQQRENIYNQSK